MSSKKKPASSRKAGERRQTPEKKPSSSKTARLVKETVSPATSATAERVVAPEGERVRQVADLGKIWEGIGKALMLHLARKCVENEWPRLQWAVLDWNTPSIDFYKSLGAEMLDEWTGVHISGDALTRLAERT